MSKQIEDLKREHAEHLSSQIDKFLNAYYEVSGSKISYKKEDYPNVIKRLGNYLFELKNELYLDTAIDLDGMIINMSLFKQTVYEQKVYNFIKSLKEMFNTRNTINVTSILSTFPQFTEEQKRACLEFYEKLNDLEKGMHRSIFSTNQDVKYIIDKESIRSYEEELKRFNDYTRKISENQDIARSVYLFNDAIHSQLIQKQHVKFFFDA